MPETLDLAESVSPEYKVQRCFVTPHTEEDIEGRHLKEQIQKFLGIEVKDVRTGVRYDVQGIDEATFNQAQKAVFGEAPVNQTTPDELFKASGLFEPQKGETTLIFEPLPGQYDQRADSAAQCIQVLTEGAKPIVKTARVITLVGNLSAEEITKIKSFLLNPVDSHETGTELPDTLDKPAPEPEDIKTLEGFTNCTDDQLKEYLSEFKMAMTAEDLKNVQNYFLTKGRDPSVTELKVLDMYWSDHCRHTTFTTELTDISFNGKKVVEKGKLLLNDEECSKTPILKSLKDFLEERVTLNEENETKTPVTLMDLALHSMKMARKAGLLNDLEVSEENNAASIIVPVLFEDGHTEEWLFMFKNETHNHPTGIEPFGGAATCLGGVIRDPLSGRSYVFMGMRLTGSGDPRESLEDTLKGKLPQARITKDAASGYSSYGNQIGLPTGKVIENYHPGFKAKRFEAGCVGGAVKKDWVVREAPGPGDLIILVGGRTGRDGIGGATGSSKTHTQESVTTCGAEVQKGNPVEERKIQRLFSKKEVVQLIKCCNDFGAGGVANAVGELADGLDINLDAVALKYTGLDGTEIAISESQERMAVVVSREDAEKFIQLAKEENLEATVVATVKEQKTLVMTWKGKKICDLDRDFLNGGWAKRTAAADIQSSTIHENLFHNQMDIDSETSITEKWINNLQQLNVCSQRGLQQRFDSTVGANSVLSPHGGKYQVTPSEAVVSTFPVDGAVTAMVMSAGYDPDMAMKDPYFGAMYAAIQSVTHIVATGADWTKTRLTLQNYFERLGNDPVRWGKPLAAQLGAKEAQKNLGLPSIGGKDSMSGTYIDKEKDLRLDVPPTLVSFAVASVDSHKVITNCFQNPDSQIIYLPATIDEKTNMPDWAKLTHSFETIHHLIQTGKISSCHSVGKGGVAAALSKMCFGNKIGADLTNAENADINWFSSGYGSFIIEVPKDTDAETMLQNVSHHKLGTTQQDPALSLRDGSKMQLDDLLEKWESPLDEIFPRKHEEDLQTEIPEHPLYETRDGKTPEIIIGVPRALIVTFPGTNCERETIREFNKAGAHCTEVAIKNLTPALLHESIQQLIENINNSQILAFPGGFSAGDEPDGSAKFSGNILRNPRIADAIEKFKERGGLILGICNGAQTIIKSKMQDGRIDVLQKDDPTLTHNRIGHYLCRMVNHKVMSVLSPWMQNFTPGETFALPAAHAEGRFKAAREVIERLWTNGQVALQYVDLDGKTSMSFDANPNGSTDAIAAVTDIRGQILWMMAHPERWTRNNQCVNIPGERLGQRIIQGGVDYFTGKKSNR